MTSEFSEFSAESAGTGKSLLTGYFWTYKEWPNMHSSHSTGRVISGVHDKDDLNPNPNPNVKSMLNIQSALSIINGTVLKVSYRSHTPKWDEGIKWHTIEQQPPRWIFARFICHVQR